MNFLNQNFRETDNEWYKERIKTLQKEFKQQKDKDVLEPTKLILTKLAKSDKTPNS